MRGIISSVLSGINDFLSENKELKADIENLPDYFIQALRGNPDGQYRAAKYFRGKGQISMRKKVTG